MVARLVRDEEVVGSNPAYPPKGSLQVSTTPDGRLPVQTPGVVYTACRAASMKLS